MGERKEKILIVDDDHANRQLLSIILKLDGYQLDTATDGREALLKFKEQHYDLMLLDLMMPLLDGYQVLKVIRSDERYQKIPVIVITAVSKRESVAHCVQLGADDYLLKPFDPNEVRQRVRNTLDLFQGRMLGERLQEVEENDLDQMERLTQRLIPAFLPFLFETNPAELAEGFLTTALQRFRAEAGTLFWSKPSGSLELAALHNQETGIVFGGTSGKSFPISTLQPLKQVGEITREDYAILTAAAIGKPIVLDLIAMRSQNTSFGLRFFEESINFIPSYLLANPLKDPSGKVIGVLELINPHHAGNDRIIPFDTVMQWMVDACCQLAAVAHILLERNSHDLVKE